MIELGLPPRYKDSVRAITPGLPLFLYNYSTHQLHGIYEVLSLLFILVAMSCLSMFRYVLNVLELFSCMVLILRLLVSVGRTLIPQLGRIKNVLVNQSFRLRYIMFMFLICTSPLIYCLQFVDMFEFFVNTLSFNIHS